MATLAMERTIPARDRAAHSDRHTAYPPAVAHFRPRVQRMRLPTLALVAALAGGRACPLLADDPFRLKGIRKTTNVWTADVYLKEWTPGEKLSFK